MSLHTENSRKVHRAGAKSAIKSSSSSSSEDLKGLQKSLSCNHTLRLYNYTHISFKLYNACVLRCIKLIILYIRNT